LAVSGIPEPTRPAWRVGERSHETATTGGRALVARRSERHTGTGFGVAKCRRARQQAAGRLRGFKTMENWRFGQFNGVRANRRVPAGRPFRRPVSAGPQLAQF